VTLFVFISALFVNVSLSRYLFWAFVFFFVYFLLSGGSILSVFSFVIF